MTDMKGWRGTQNTTQQETEIEELSTCTHPLETTERHSKILESLDIIRKGSKNIRKDRDEGTQRGSRTLTCGLPQAVSGSSTPA
jgi:hypothetical protein